MAYSVRKGKRKENEWFLFNLKAQAISAMHWKAYLIA